MGKEVSIFQILFVYCGPVGYVLWALSLATVAVIIEHFVSIRRNNILPRFVRDQVSGMFENRQFREAIELTSAQTDMLSFVLHAALTEAPYGYPAMERAMEEAADEQTTKLLRHVEWLNLIGNISPMLGLLGTVAGMIVAFFQIVAAAGNVEADKLAGGIGQALVTTLLGLSIAIPALATYAIMRNRIDGLTSETMLASQELLATFRPQKKAT